MMTTTAFCKLCQKCPHYQRWVGEVKQAVNENKVMVGNPGVTLRDYCWHIVRNMIYELDTGQNQDQLTNALCKSLGVK